MGTRVSKPMHITLHIRIDFRAEGDDDAVERVSAVLQDVAQVVESADERVRAVVERVS